MGGFSQMSLSSSPDPPGLSLFPNMWKCWDMSSAGIWLLHLLPIPGCSHSVLPALGHRECHWRTRLWRTPLENPAREPGFLTRRFLTRRFPLLNEHKIFPCCQLLGSFVLLRAALAQGKSPLELAWPPGSRESPGWVSPGLSIPILTMYPETPWVPSPASYRHSRVPGDIPMAPA